MLPAVALDVLDRPWLLLTPSGELLMLIGLVVATSRWRRAAWIRRGAAVVGSLLWIYAWDELIARSIVHHTPPLYDQLFLLRHLGVLVLDLWGWTMALGLLGGGLAIVLLVMLMRALLRATLSGFEQTRQLELRAGAAIIVVVVGMLSLLDMQGERPRRERRVQWLVPAISANLDASWGMYQTLERGLDDSPYAHFEQTYTLTRKPDVHLLLVESYGRILIADPEAGPLWREQITEIETRLTAKGWHAVSAFSRAPISGGRSWLAEATLLTGVFVRFEGVFQHLVADIDRTPNLVAYLDAQGYETILLAPKDRPRPGVEDVNRYNYDTRIQALDLAYDGPRFGWGIVPDQYSLGFAQDNVYAKTQGPMFTNFHMVSSHAPWQMIPEFVDDWRDLNGIEAPPEADSQRRLAEPGEEFLSRVRRYKRVQPRYTWMGDADALKIDAYWASIRYDLELLARHLESMERDSIVILMGDHQPPILSGEDMSFDVPVHILARDPALLEEFREQGFVDGLALNDGRPTMMAHEGMFSLLMRTLVRCCSQTPDDLPPYLPDGALGARG